MKQSTKAVDYALLRISSPAFVEDGLIPATYTCDGVDTNPAIHIEGIPGQAKTLAIIVDDPDAPHGTWAHWVAWNIPVSSQIKENTAIATEGVNDFGKHRYNGPCPPSGTHHYHFKVYALNGSLTLSTSTNKKGLEHAMAGHILAFGDMTGRYERQ